MECTKFFVKSRPIFAHFCKHERTYETGSRSLIAYVNLTVDEGRCLNIKFVHPLIENMRKNRCLFDKRDAFYFNKFKKEKAWNDVAKETRKSSTECKNKWKSLRERFSRELRKQNMPPGSGASAEVDWELFEELAFLRDSVKPRLTICIETTEAEETSTSANDSSVSFNIDGFFSQSKSTVEECPASSAPMTKIKVEQKVEEQIAQPAATIQGTDEDALYLQTVHSLLKDLPVAPKDQFKAEMISRVVELRNHDALYLQTVHSLLKELPVASKDQFKAEMISRVVELRNQHRSNLN